jgi:hypothetical protein
MATNGRRNERGIVGALVTAALTVLGPVSASATPSGAALVSQVALVASQPGGALRWLGQEAAALLTDARRVSPTVARQMADLDRSGVVVYVKTRLVPRCSTGRLTLLGAAGNVRYLKIEISATNRRDDAIGWLGHELQHALEVAAAADVRNEAGLERLYRRIGQPQGHQASRFETDAAVRAGEQVLAEVRASRRTLTGSFQ